MVFKNFLEMFFAMAMDLLSEDITEDEAQVDFEYRYSQALVNGGSKQKIMKLNVQLGYNEAIFILDFN